MSAALRTAVQDRRRLVREVLATLLAAEPAVSSVTCVATLDELAGAVGQGELDVVVLSTPDDPPQAWLRASLRLHRFTDDTSASSVVSAVCGYLDPGGRTARAARNTLRDSRILTQRETEILNRIADGMSSLQVATSLGISPRTVENHKQRIFAKLGVRSQAHAVAVALASGDLPPIVARHEVASVRVLVADPSPLLREVLSAPFSDVTSDDLECVGAVGSLTELRASLPAIAASHGVVGLWFRRW